jgi:hypothetical protein
VDKKSESVICTNFGNGKKHDFKLFKDSKVRWLKPIQAMTDTGYLGIQKICASSVLPKKRSKLRTLTKEEKTENRKIASQRALNENVISRLKRFKLVSERYRNRRKRFGLRFNLIVGIYNYEMAQ